MSEKSPDDTTIMHESFNGDGLVDPLESNVRLQQAHEDARQREREAFDFLTAKNELVNKEEEQRRVGTLSSDLKQDYAAAYWAIDNKDLDAYEKALQGIAMHTENHESVAVPEPEPSAPAPTAVDEPVSDPTVEVSPDTPPQEPTPIVEPTPTEPTAPTPPVGSREVNDEALSPKERADKMLAQVTAEHDEVSQMLAKIHDTSSQLAYNRALNIYTTRLTSFGNLAMTEREVIEAQRALATVVEKIRERHADSVPQVVAPISKEQEPVAPTRKLSLEEQKLADAQAALAEEEKKTRDALERAGRIDEILKEDDEALRAERAAQDAASSKPASSPATPPPGPAPAGSAPASPEKTKEDIEKEITDLQEQLGPKSEALYAARADAGQSAIKKRGWIKRTLAKGGMFGGVDPSEFDPASKTKIEEAEKEYSTLASQLEQKLDERSEARFRERIKNASDDTIRKHLVRVRTRKIQWKGGQGVVQGDVDAYKAGKDANFVEDLKLAKTSGRFRGIYLKQAEVDRKMYVDSLPPAERSKVMETLSKVAAKNKKYRHARIIGTAAVLTSIGAATGGIGAAAFIFGGKLVRSYGSIVVGAGASAMTAQVIGHVGERNIEKKKNIQTKEAIGNLRTGTADEIKKQEQAQEIIDAKARAEQRLKVTQVVGAAVAGVAAGGIAAYEAGAAGLGRANTDNLYVPPQHTVSDTAASHALEQHSAPSASPTTNVTPTATTPKFPEMTLTQDSPHAPYVPPQHTVSDTAASHALEQQTKVANAGPTARGLEAPKMVVEGNYGQGSSMTREIDHWLKQQPAYHNLTDTQRARVAYRIALDEMEEMRHNPATESQWHIQHHDPNSVRLNDSFKAELDPDKVKAHVQHVLENKQSGVSAHDHVKQHPTSGKPHEWVKSHGSEGGRHSIDASRTALEKQFGLHDNTRFWNVMHEENVMHLKEIVDSRDPTALEQFAHAKGVSVDAIRDMVNRIDALSQSGKTPIGPLDTPASLLERAAQVRAGTFTDAGPHAPKTVQWVSEHEQPKPLASAKPSYDGFFSRPDYMVADNGSQEASLQHYEAARGADLQHWSAARGAALQHESAARGAALQHEQAARMAGRESGGRRWFDIFATGRGVHASGGVVMDHRPGHHGLVRYTGPGRFYGPDIQHRFEFDARKTFGGGGRHGHR